MLEALEKVERGGNGGSTVNDAVASSPSAVSKEKGALSSSALLAGGGALYTLGAVVYATRRPDPFPRVFG